MTPKLNKTSTGLSSIVKVNVHPVTPRKIKGVIGNKKARYGRARSGLLDLSTNKPRTLAKVLRAIVNPAKTRTDSKVEDMIKTIAIVD
tara:strand:- start:140 stop:403 length:264 start_codon:yes stop_codon:yes gene_type:complete